ncbi:MAG TPA: sigma factor-like helix-turn-helix DNA-binding protein, partial [Blastocatellia bacterium]|nr:sigma factor-like helix-turn-helix DNA-binding protein [Blastocatellia bacterium]
KQSAGPDDSTLESAYRRFGAHVYSLCMRLLGDAPGAEAATVRAFVAVGRRLAQGWDDSRTFLHLREAAIADSLSTTRVPASLPVSATRTVIETVLAGEQLNLRLPLKPALLDLLVAQLPEAERLAYVLRDVEGLSDEAVASRLRMSKVDERRLLHRARLALRRLWLAQ